MQRILYPFLACGGAKVVKFLSRHWIHLIGERSKEVAPHGGRCSKTHVRRGSLRAGLRAGTHLSAATAMLLVFAGSHSALTTGATVHFRVRVCGHHGASLTVFCLAARTILTTGGALGAAAAILVSCHLGMIAAGTRFGVVVGGSGRVLRCALGHQSQSHQYGAKKYESFRFHRFLGIFDWGGPWSAVISCAIMNAQRQGCRDRCRI